LTASINLGIDTKSIVVSIPKREGSQDAYKRTDQCIF